MTFAIITPALITGATADRLKFSAYAIVHRDLAGPRLRARGPLGVRRRVAGRHGRARLRRWRGRAHQRRRRRAGHGDRAGHAPRLPRDADAARTACRSRCSAPASCGSAGPASTPGRRSPPTASPPRPSPTRSSPPPRRCCGWLLVEKLRSGHATTLGAASGAVAGLVAITPVRRLRGRHGTDLHRRDRRRGLLPGPRHQAGRSSYDDSLDVIAVHLVGGLVGSLLLGFFADSAINPVVANEGLFLGGGATPAGRPGRRLDRHAGRTPSS